MRKPTEIHVLVDSLETPQSLCLFFSDNNALFASAVKVRYTLYSADKTKSLQNTLYSPMLDNCSHLNDIILK